MGDERERRETATRETDARNTQKTHKSTAYNIHEAVCELGINSDDGKAKPCKRVVRKRMHV